MSHSAKIVVQMAQRKGQVSKVSKRVLPEFRFTPADKPRLAYIQWPEAGNIPGSQGFVIEGVTLYSPDPSYVLYESLD